MYETRQNKRRYSRISSHFSTGSLLQLVDNRRKNATRLCMQMARHVKASCSITTKEKGNQTATCTSQSPYAANQSSIIWDMNIGVTTTQSDNALYQCAEPKSLYAVLGPRSREDTELNRTNLVRSELKTIQWSNVKWYDDSNPNKLLEDAKPCDTCSQWIDPKTLKPHDEAINKVKLTYETEEDREQARKQEREGKRVTETYAFKKRQNFGNSQIGSLRVNIQKKVNDSGISDIQVSSAQMNIYISYPAKMQDSWNNIKKEFSLLVSK